MARKSLTGSEGSFFSSAPRTIARANGCSLARSTLAASASKASFERPLPSATSYGRDLRLAFGERAGFVDDERIDFGERFESFGVSNEDAGVGAATDGDHDGHGRGEAEGAGARDDQHGDGGDERVSETRLGTNERPACEGQQSGDDYCGYKIAGHCVSEALHRRATALRFADEFDDLRQECFVADSFGAHHKTSAGVQRAAGDFVAGGFFDGHWFAGDHRFVDGAGAFENHAVDRNALARAHAEPIALFNDFKRDILLCAVARNCALASAPDSAESESRCWFAGARAIQAPGRAAPAW